MSREGAQTIFFVEKMKFFSEKLSRRNLKLFEGPTVGQELAEKPPSLLGRVLQGAGGLAPEEVQVGEEVVRAALALEAGDELEQDSVDPVSDGRLVPLDLPRVLLELVEDDRLDDVVGHRVARQVEVLVPQRLQDGQHLASAAAVEQPIFDLGETDDPGVALHG